MQRLYYGNAINCYAKIKMDGLVKGLPGTDNISFHLVKQTI